MDVLKALTQLEMKELSSLFVIRSSKMSLKLVKFNLVIIIKILIKRPTACSQSAVHKSIDTKMQFIKKHYKLIVYISFELSFATDPIEISQLFPKIRCLKGC